MWLKLNILYIRDSLFAAACIALTRFIYMTWSCLQFWPRFVLLIFWPRVALYFGLELPYILVITIYKFPLRWTIYFCVRHFICKIVSNVIKINQYTIHFIYINESMHRTLPLSQSHRLSWLLILTEANLQASGAMKIKLVCHDNSSINENV